MGFFPQLYEIISLTIIILQHSKWHATAYTCVQPASLDNIVYRIHLVLVFGYLIQNQVLLQHLAYISTFLSHVCSSINSYQFRCQISGLISVFLFTYDVDVCFIWCTHNHRKSSSLQSE
jgi:hypothetical protein